MRELLKRDGLLHGDAPTVDGRTIAEIAADARRPRARKSSCPSKHPSRRAVAWRSCTGRWRRTAAS